MSIPGDASPLLLGGGAQQYKIERSLRFNSSDSAYLSRTPASAGNRKTWTLSCWVKATKFDTYRGVFEGYTGSPTFSNRTSLQINNTNQIDVLFDNNTSGRLTTTQVFRDPSAWYHLLFGCDTTQSTASNRFKIYVNGSQVTTFSNASYPAQNLDTGINTTQPLYFGRVVDPLYADFYLADIHFIDGQALDPSSFAETNATTGQWVPKAYTGTYGTNGFRLAFADNSNNTATTLGKDSSPNGNNFTPFNLSVTAGAGNDSLVDTPTSYGTDTGAGGEVRGNYCTLNPLSSTGTISNGNLDSATNAKTNYGTIAYPTTGKWYWECTLGGGGVNLGLAAYRTNAAQVYLITDSCLYSAAGVKNVDGVLDVPFGSSANSGDIIGVAANADTSSVEFFKNGVSMGTISHGVSGRFAVIGDGNLSQTATANFGQRPFAYTAPSGFKALCDTNLPAPVVAKPNTAFDVALWTGNGSARSITGLNFNPDFVWIKGRSGATDHALYDVVRGTEKRLESNTTDAEVTSDGGVTAFNSDGFSLGTLAQVNTNSSTYVGWAWDGGTSTVTNTQGSITSQVRANASAGFSIVTYTGTGSGSTIGHGLGVTPSMIIVKGRTNIEQWGFWHRSLSAADKFLYFSLTSNEQTSSTVFNGTLPTSSVFSVGTWPGTNASSINYVAYCFAPVAGYSSFGSYTGNGSADGPFVYTGFRPRWILIKNSGGGSTSSLQGWVLQDTSRSSFNVTADTLFANNSNASSSNSIYGLDILSNGFKTRGTDGAVNESNATYIYAAFAENPFQYARAR